MVDNATAIGEMLDGRWRSSPYGSCFVAESSYDIAHVHGTGAIQEFLRLEASVLADLCRDQRIRDVDLSSTVFLDIETTGLQQCTNTLAFLVGVGFFEGDKLHVQQYFLPSPAHERAMLDSFKEWLSGRGLIVTYNGRNFDVPMLAYRYGLHSMSSTLVDMPHADLLPPARRLWRERLVSCRLISLERNILGLRRVGDVRGDRIPALYNQFVLDSDPKPLAPVFYHNVQDILTLLAITCRAATTYADPYGSRVEDGLDFLSLGRAYEKAGETDRAVLAYNKALTLPMDSPSKAEACRHLIPLCKQRARAGGATSFWEEMIASCDVPGCIYPYEELAKYYEHEKQDYARAEALILLALELLPRDYCARTTREQLEKKLQRVRSKRDPR